MDVDKFGMLVFETAETVQLLESIEDPELDKVVIVKVFAVLVVEGDNMLEIEKEMVLPEEAELLKQLLKDTCGEKEKQLKLDIRRTSLESFVQTCV